MPTRDFTVRRPFDPDHSTLLLEPEKPEPGYWVGAPSATIDPNTGDVLLYVRHRTGPGRGGECTHMRSADGAGAVTAVWSATKDQIPAISIERAALIWMPGEPLRMYMSYEDPSDGRWKIDLVEADDVSELDVASARRVIEPEGIGLLYVKDPWACYVGGKTYLYCHFREYSGRKATGLAVSDDGLEFKWSGEVIGPGSGWDAYCVRITSIAPAGPLYMAFYDGAPFEDENQEERTGVAASADLRHFRSLTPRRPALRSKSPTESLRYVEVLDHPDGRRLFYFETSRADGSHELRVAVR